MSLKILTSQNANVASSGVVTSWTDARSLTGLRIGLIPGREMALKCRGRRILGAWQRSKLNVVVGSM